MPVPESERLALQLQELIERRARLLAFRTAALQKTLTDEERADIASTLEATAHEIAELERQLDELRKQPGGGGTG